MYRKRKGRHGSEGGNEKEAEIAALRTRGALDPVLAHLSRFTLHEDLDQRIEQLFAGLDKGTLRYEELHSGLKEMRFARPVTLTVLNV